MVIFVDVLIVLSFLLLKHIVGVLNVQYHYDEIKDKSTVSNINRYILYI